MTDKQNMASPTPVGQEAQNTKEITSLELENRQQVIEQARKMHPIATELQAQYPVIPEEYEQNNPLIPSKPKSFIRRFTGALLIPFLLSLVAFIVLAAVGDSGLISINTFIQKYWITGMVCRVGLYCLFAWIIVPNMLRNIKHRKLLELHYYYEQAKQEPRCDIQTLWEIESRMQRVAQSHLSPWLIFSGLLLFDLIAVELPFILK